MPRVPTDLAAAGAAQPPAHPPGRGLAPETK